MSDLPMNDDCEACEPAISSDLPEITNRPGLDAVQYRLRTYATFRQAMLSRIPFERIQLDSGEPLPPRLAGWTARQDDDFGVALIDMWAYVADILTFYQERTANEAYLRTARLRASLRRLAALLNYRPAPGVASVAYLAFTLQAPTPSSPQTVIPEDLRAQSVPGQNEKPQKFETQETRLARFAWNRLLPVTRAPQVLTTSTTQLYLTGKIGTIKPGDVLLIVGDERIALPENEQWDFRVIEAIDYPPGQTRVTLGRRLGLSRRNIEPGSNPRIYVFRRRASLFGFNATVLSTLPPMTRLQLAGYIVETTSTAVINGNTTTITSGIKVTDPRTNTVVTNPTLPDDWDFIDDAQNAPAANFIDLDAEYAKILNGSWLVLERPNYTELYRIEDVATEARADFMLSAKVTRLALDTTENLRSFVRSPRRVVVHTEPEELPLDTVPVTDAVSGDSVDVVGDLTALERGRPFVFAGVQAGEAAQEIAYLLETTLLDSGDTRLRFTEPLKNTYARDTLQIYGNVVRATHGETVREVLGNGDAAQPFQTFALQKAPLTYVPETGAPNGAGSTLDVRVNNLLWNEVPSFYGTASDQAVYTTETDEAGKTTVRFGDGSTGQRLPTGRGNVSAVYRQGIGKVGDVRAGTITTLLDRPLGVKSVVNPKAAEGGAEPESQESIRTNAPNTVRTFGRIVSLRDFEDAARQYAGIAKARAALKWSGEDEYVQLIVAGDDGAAVTPGGAKYNDLLADLNARRDPNRNLRMDSYIGVPVTLSAKIIVETPKFLVDDVLAAVRAAVLTYFAFDNLDLGQTIYLSDVYRVMQDVPGVVAVDIDAFTFVMDDLPEQNSARLAYLRAQAPRGVTFSIRGGRAEPDPVQVFAGARSSEIITLSDSALTLTQGEEPTT